MITDQSSIHRDISRTAPISQQSEGKSESRRLNFKTAEKGGQKTSKHGIGALQIGRFECFNANACQRATAPETPNRKRGRMEKNQENTERSGEVDIGGI